MAELMMKNPGLKSRFPTAITFPDYTSEEMMAIAEKMLLNDVSHARAQSLDQGWSG